MSDHDERRLGDARTPTQDGSPSGAAPMPGKRPLTGGLARTTHELAPRSSAATNAPTATPDAPTVLSTGSLPVVGDVLTAAQAITGQLLPGYRVAVDMIHAEAALELGLRAVDVYAQIATTRAHLAEGDAAGNPAAYVGELAQVDAVLVPTEQALAWHLGPQTFHGRPVIASAYATPLGHRAEHAARLHAEVLLVASLLATVRRVIALVPPAPARTSTPVDSSVATQVVDLVEPWRSRPVNFAFLRQALSVAGVWSSIESLHGARLRTLDQTDEDVRAQAHKTGALGDVGDFDGAQVEGLVVPNGFDQAGAKEVQRMLASSRPDTRGGLIVQLAKMGRLDAVLGAAVCPRVQVQQLNDSLPFDGAPSNRAARRLLLPLLEAPITFSAPLFGIHDVPMGDKSTTRLLDEAIEETESETLRNYLRIARAAYHGGTFGFAGEHDAAYDQLQAGATTTTDYGTAKTSAMKKAGVVGGVSLLTGGALGAAGGELVEALGPRAVALVEGAIGGMGAGFSGAMASDGYDVAAGHRDIGDVSPADWGRAGFYGGALGVGLSATSELSSAAARHLPGRGGTGGGSIHPGMGSPIGAQPAFALAEAGLGDDGGIPGMEASRGKGAGSAAPNILEARRVDSDGSAPTSSSQGGPVGRSVGSGANADPVAWVEELKARLSAEELEAFERMARKRTPAQIQQQFGGRIDSGISWAQQKGLEVHAERVSLERAAELRNIIEQRGLMKDPVVVDILDGLGPTPKPQAIDEAIYRIRSRLVTSVVGEETAAGYPGTEVLRDVQVWLEQSAPGKGSRMLRTPKGLRPHRAVTDVDLMVIERPSDGGKAKIVHREELKSGHHDQPSEATRQLENGAHAISSAARGEQSIRLLVDDVDITDTIDFSSVDASTGVTRGPLNKEFDRTLGISADDLKKLVEEFAKLERGKPTTGGGK